MVSTEVKSVSHQADDPHQMFTPLKSEKSQIVPFTEPAQSRPKNDDTHQNDVPRLPRLTFDGQHVIEKNPTLLNEQKQIEKSETKQTLPPPSPLLLENNFEQASPPHAPFAIPYFS